MYQERKEEDNLNFKTNPNTSQASEDYNENFHVPLSTKGQAQTQGTTPLHTGQDLPNDGGVLDTPQDSRGSSAAATAVMEGVQSAPNDKIDKPA